MKRKIIALLLVVLTIMSSVTTVFANVQLAVDELKVTDVYYVIGENIVTGDPIINPTMSIEWTDPDAWAGTIDVHEPSEYRVTVTNNTYNTSNQIKVYRSAGTPQTTSMDIHNEMTLKTGSFYEIKVHPYHYHIVDNGGGEVLEEASSVETPAKAYAITDLQVDFETSEDSIQVIWDDLGQASFEYRIVYALGDYTNSSKQDLLNNAEGQITGLTSSSDDVEAYFDTTEQRNKLSYLLDENIYPGQIYSILVEPMVDYYNGAVIVRNRNYPFIQSTSTDVNLSLVEEGDYIRLQWDIPSSFKVGQDKDQYTLVEATLKQFKDGQASNIAIFNGDAAAIGYYRLLKPIWETEYQIVLTYKAIDDTSKPSIEPESNLLTYVPSEYLITPTKPYVPEILNESIVKELKTLNITDRSLELKDKYLVPGDDYTDSMDQIFDARVTFHTDDDLTGINFVWGAFNRINVDVTSSTYGESIADTNIYYDLWVSDELSALSHAIPVLSDARYTSATDDNVIADDSNTILGYKHMITEYYDDDLSVLKEVAKDKLYYIKIQAKKVTSQGTLYSKPTITSIYYDYEGDSFAPPTLAKPPLSVDETTEESISIKWRESWYEAMATGDTAPAALTDWRHQVWVNQTTGEVSSESEDSTTYVGLYESEDKIQDLRDYLEPFGAPTIISRHVSLTSDKFDVSDIKYKFYSLPYEYVLSKIEEGQVENNDSSYSFDDYYEELIADDTDDTDETPNIPWQTIEPYKNSDDLELLGYQQEDLIANTSYLLMLLPYRVLPDGTVLNSHYPTPIVASTDPIDVEPTPNPTVPNLYVKDATDMSLTAMWKYNTDFTYELMYGITEDIDDAEVYPFTLPEDVLDIDYPQNGSYYPLVVDDLFPLTTYYFWVRAKQVSTGETSLWSNPAIGNTLDTSSPIPPRGVGLPPLWRIEPYGYEDSVTENYIMIEWLKDLDDVETTSTNKVQKSFAYIIEIADNAKFVDPIYVESSGGTDDVIPSSVEILEKNMIKVNDLIPNRNYYIRLKTRVRVIGSLEGQLLIKDSVSYTEPLRIITLSTGSEYDGYIDPALTVLPSEDYEIIYDSDKDMLIFRFRDDSTDDSGAADNNVDQRLISDLIAKGLYEYEIDLDDYEGKNVDSRRIIIPYSIIEAFDAHQVDLKILADEMTIDLPSNAVMASVSDQVKAFGVAPQVIIDINELDVAHTLGLLPEDNLKSVATPQKLGVQVKSTRKTDVIGYTDEAMTIGMKTNSRYEVYDQDLALYVQDSRAKWTKTSSNYDTPQGMMMFETADVGSYGVYVEEHTSAVENNAKPSHWSEVYRKDVFGQITVEGLDGYNPDAFVSEKNLVQAVYGTAMSDTTIDLTDSMSDKEMLTLQRAGLKEDGNQGDGTISREEAIAMFVRAKEIQSQQIVTVDTSAYNTILSNNQIASVYKTDLAKAYKLGLVTDLGSIRPKDAMTYGEFFAIWSRTLK